MSQIVANLPGDPNSPRPADGHPS